MEGRKKQRKKERNEGSKKGRKERRKQGGKKARKEGRKEEGRGNVARKQARSEKDMK